MDSGEKFRSDTFRIFGLSLMIPFGHDVVNVLEVFESWSFTYLGIIILHAVLFLIGLRTVSVAYGISLEGGKNG